MWRIRCIHSIYRLSYASHRVSAILYFWHALSSLSWFSLLLQTAKTGSENAERIQIPISFDLEDATTKPKVALVTGSEV